ncbi:CdaR family protein [Salibacteraceae bacterium]|nr:CdaR family protein [Salibacteraceae bacterium]
MAKESFFTISEIFRDRKKLTVFLACVAVSILSWLMISLSQDYNTTALVPVNFINFPENKVLLNNVPDQMAVNISGSGFDLMKYDDHLIEDTLTINLDDLKMSVSGDYERGYLDPAILSRSLQKRINGEIGINRVLSDSIEFLFDLKVSRTVKVKPMVQYTLEKGYVMVDSVIAEPSEVEVFGPLSILDTLQFLKTMTINVGEVNSIKVYRVPIVIDRYGNDARVEPDSVKIRMKVDRLTEKQFMISPQQLNVPDSLQMLCFPNSIEVTAQLPLSSFDDITKSQFHVTIDYNQLQEGFMGLPVNLERWPSDAAKVSVNPKQVEIVFSKLEK